MMSRLVFLQFVSRYTHTPPLEDTCETHFRNISGGSRLFRLDPLVGWITYWTGSQRLGMSTILIFFVAGFVLMLTVRERAVTVRER
jgi:hypothetical protein